MTRPIDTTAIRRRADAGDVPALCDEVERLRELVRRAYLEGFCDGDRTLFDSPERCWEWSSSKKEV